MGAICIEPYGWEATESAEVETEVSAERAERTEGGLACLRKTERNEALEELGGGGADLGLRKVLSESEGVMGSKGRDLEYQLAFAGVEGFIEIRVKSPRPKSSADASPATQTV